MGERNNLRLVTRMDIVEFPSWLISYDFEGEQWGIDIPARTEQEALERLKALGSTGKIDGEFKFSLPAWAASNWMVNIVVTWLNFWNLILGKAGGKQ